MTKKQWLETTLNRTDAGDWDYSKTVKTISRKGGPEEFISNIFSDGEKAGGVITAIAILTTEAMMLGVAWSINKYKEYKKKKIEEYSKRFNETENLESEER